MNWISTTTFLQKRSRPITVIKTYQDSSSPKDFISCGIKIAWPMIIVCATLVCLYQCSERMAHYISNPSKVNAQLIQNSTIKLPAVTICPSISFTNTRVPVLNEYLIKKRYGNFSIEEVLNWLEKGNISLSEIWNLAKVNIVSISLINNGVAEHSATTLKELISVTEVYTPVGTCHQIKMLADIKKVNAHPLLVLEVKEEGEKPPLPKTISVTLPEESAIEAYFYHLKGVSLPRDNYVKYVGRLAESIFRQTSTNPCGGNKNVSDCLARCFENYFISKATKKICRLPFMRYFNNTPQCRSRMELDDMLTATKLAIRKFTPVECNCSRNCRQVLYQADYIHYKETYKDFIWWFEVNVPDGRITILKEEAAYSGYDLFSDLGGILGLWLGLCFLDLLELGASVLLKFWIKLFSEKKQSKPKAVAGRRFRITVARVPNIKTKTIVGGLHLPGFRNIVKKKSPIWIRALWLTISMVTLVTCIYQCVELIALNFSDPSTVNVYVSSNITVPFPSIMVCPKRPDGLIPALSSARVQEKLGQHHTHEEVLQLISHGQLTIEEAWNMTGFPIYHMHTATSVSEWISSVVPTIVGNCLTFQSNGTVKVPNTMFLNIFTDYEQGSKLIMTYPSENLDLVKYLLQLDCTELEFEYSAWRVDTAFRITLVTYRNVYNSPCLESKEVVRCLLECLEKKIALKIPQGHCRLPFMHTTAPSCTSATAMATMLNATFQMINSFNKEDCTCLRACKEFVYEKEYLTTSPVNMSRTLAVQMVVWNKEITIMEEISAYNGFALICDLGGSMGLFSGLCIIHFFDIIEMVFAKLLIFFNLRFCAMKRKDVGPQGYHRRIVIEEVGPNAVRRDNRVTVTSTQKNSWSWNGIWRFFLYTLMFCTCAFLSVERIQYYASDPSIYTTYYSTNKTIVFPLMLICPEIDHSLYGKDEDSFLNYWNLSTFQPKVIDIRVNKEKVRENNAVLKDDLIFSVIATAAGVCLMIALKKPVEYNWYATDVNIFLLFKSPKNSWMAAVPGEKLPLVKYLTPRDCYFLKTQPTYWVRVSLQITQLIRRNTRKQPCKDGPTVASCLADCIGTKIYDNPDVKCRLPFMKETNSYHLCLTKKEYLEVKNATLDVLENFNLADCDCGRECRATLYSVDEITFLSLPTPAVLFKLQIPENNFLIIQEEAGNSFIKLFSDIGGSVGMFFGIGLMQIIQMLIVSASKKKKT